MSVTTTKNTLTAVSYNMHGFNQGLSTVRDISLRSRPDIFLLQEHWLTEANLHKFDQIFTDYFFFGSPATNSSSRGFSSGRPAGGTAVLINRLHKTFCRTLFCSNRCVIVKLFDYVIINLYLPCVGYNDRLLIIDETLHDISNCIEQYNSSVLLLGGDFNCDLDNSSAATSKIIEFANDLNLLRCDNISGFRTNTYVNLALNCSSCIDYFFISDSKNVLNYQVTDVGSNLSDHLPLEIECRLDSEIKKSNNSLKNKQPRQSFLRWDHADKVSYYHMTGQHLQSLLDDLLAFDFDSVNIAYTDICSFIEYVYCRIVTILRDAAKLTVPLRSKNFYKFWWNEELDCLKEDSISTHALWLAAGKPRCGLIASKARAAKLLYKKTIRKYQQKEQSSYTNDLHDALLSKDNISFWKCFRSKFNHTLNNAVQVNGFTDEQKIADSFADHFKKCSTQSTNNSRLSEVYHTRRPSYCGIPFDD